MASAGPGELLFGSVVVAGSAGVLRLRMGLRCSRKSILRSG